MGDTEAARGNGGASAMHDAAADFVKLEDHRVPSRKGGEELPAWRLVLDRVAGLALMVRVCARAGVADTVPRQYVDTAEHQLIVNSTWVRLSAAHGVLGPVPHA